MIMCGFSCLFSLAYYPLMICAYVSFFSYIAMFVVQWACARFAFLHVDMAKKYDAKWALVTGASSGIGLALARKLAAQKISVIMAALDDDVLTKAFAAAQKDFPDVEFRKCGVNLGVPGYLDDIAKACKDVSPNLIFNNAGYVVTGFFADSPLERQMANYECNATAAMTISHHFASEMKKTGTKGVIAFTSSPAGLMPSPMTTMYGATKAFVTEFAGGLAAELHPDGIDVLTVHPSPVATSFYSGNKHDIKAMKFFQSTATTSDAVADCFFGSVGRFSVHDQGYFCIALRQVMLRAIDISVLTNIMKFAACQNGDFKALQAKTAKASKKAE
jgi:short-subunit dehydrogenase